MPLVPADLPQRVARFLHLYSTLNAQSALGVAVSGGADSVVLLHLLNELAKPAGARLVVAHVNHQLRCEESDRDEEFVRQLAASMGWPVKVLRERPGPGNVEAEARRIRQAFFRRVVREEGLQFLATGHTESDQAETVLLRLFRGAGLAGLGGMAPVGSNRILRPLLTATRTEVRAFARERGLEWREDQSNKDLGLRRNRLRERVIPQLERHFNPRLSGVLAGTAQLARDEEEYWTGQIEPLFVTVQVPAPLPGVFVDISQLNALHVTVRRRLIRRAIREVSGGLRSVDFEHVEAILGLLTTHDGHSRVQVPGVDALRSFGTLRLARLEDAARRTEYSLAVCPEVLHLLPERAGTISVNPVTGAASNCVTVKDEKVFFAEQAELDGESLERVGGMGSLRVRNWEPGDRLQPVGWTATVKLKTLFQEHQVLLWERRLWPVLLAGSEIVWTRQFGVAAPFRASNASRWRVLLRFRIDWPGTLAG